MSLHERSVAVLAYPGYQELEFWYPVFRAREEGADVSIVAPSADPCESFLGYPVIGNADAGTLEAGSLDALVVPGTVEGLPPASEAQRDLVRAVHAAGGKVYAAGSGAALVKDVLGDAFDPSTAAAGPDDLPALVRRLLDDLAS